MFNFFKKKKVEVASEPLETPTSKQESTPTQEQSYHKNKTYFKIMDRDWCMGQSSIFETEEEARKEIEVLKARANEYWSKRTNIVIKVTEEVLG